MNKAQLIDRLSAQLGSKKAATDAVEAVVDTITRAVASGEKVAITGFGAFEKVARPARTGRNPRTGAAVKIKKTTVPKFRPGQGFKDVVSGAKKLPKAAVSVAKAATGTTPAKKTTAKKTAAKKTAAKKAPAKKTPAKKAPEAPRTAQQVADVEGPEVTTPVGTTAADAATNPDTTETDLQQPGTEPLMDPATTKAVASEAETLQKAADPDKG